MTQSRSKPAPSRACGTRPLARCGTPQRTPVLGGRAAFATTDRQHRATPGTRHQLTGPPARIAYLGSREEGEETVAEPNEEQDDLHVVPLCQGSGGTERDGANIGHQERHGALAVVALQTCKPNGWRSAERHGPRGLLAAGAQCRPCASQRTRQVGQMDENHGARQQPCRVAQPGHDLARAQVPAGHCCIGRLKNLPTVLRLLRAQAGTYSIAGVSNSCQRTMQMCATARTGGQGQWVSKGVACTARLLCTLALHAPGKAPARARPTHTPRQQRRPPPNRLQGAAASTSAALAGARHGAGMCGRGSSTRAPAKGCTTHSHVAFHATKPKYTSWMMHSAKTRYCGWGQGS